MWLSLAPTTLCSQRAREILLHRPSSPPSPVLPLIIPLGITLCPSHIPKLPGFPRLLTLERCLSLPSPPPARKHQLFFQIMELTYLNVKLGAKKR